MDSQVTDPKELRYIRAATSLEFPPAYITNSLTPSTRQTIIPKLNLS